MKKNLCRYISLIFILSVTLSILIGCSKGPYDGEWSYIHDDKTVALVLSGKKAEVDGIKCSVNTKGDVLELTGSDGSHYEVSASDTKDRITLYKFTTYEYKGEGEPDGLIGVWESKEKWSFEFTKDGTFKEDGYFPGYFTENRDEKTIKLVYNDHFVDTVCKYSVEGNKLIVEYPWPMVKTAK